MLLTLQHKRIYNKRGKLQVKLYHRLLLVDRILQTELVATIAENWLLEWIALLAKIPSID